ncbi:hypothetical protein GSI_08698 [Ganoderma sinense ZZ0214-1]|uniref:Protein-S-isoprenylcysteine O-methyltransferase n=1 Tax=Ganoderma sinense ZZ0214-1 TaxID=1077348 RepID=A0A2G8S4F1_9APHY|nr:hypothetical protein GSI_08698 [Ganoderma sinense ZZ0214-1]
MDLRYLAKVPAFAIIIAAEYITFRPPNPTPKNVARDKFCEPMLITLTARLYPLLGVVVNPCLHLCEVATVLAREFPSPLSDRVLAALLTHPANAHNLAISPTFLVGLLLIVLGAAWRKRCYDALGRFFTFQLALHKEHKLVTTGPYAIVRHPSYTAFLMTDLGCLMTLMLPGSYVYESGILQTSWVAVCVALWGAVLVGLGLAAVKRARVEDAVLREEFGSEWDAWARKTQYALIPYVY